MNDDVYHHDFRRRVSPRPMPRKIHCALQVMQSPAFTDVKDLFSAIEHGRELTPFLSRMKSQKKAYKKACASGNWDTYRRQMDFLLNKWGVFHFHIKNDSWLVFVYLSPRSPDAYILDILPHNGNWAIEHRLVAIAASSFPKAGIATALKEAVSSTMTEADHFTAKRRGMNTPVAVNGVFYVPSSGGLMSDGSAFANVPRGMPVVYVGARYDQNSQNPIIKHPNFMVVGLDGDDPEPPWVAAAGYAGMMARLRQDRS